MENNYYVYYFKDGVYTFDRTCGTETSAAARVIQLKVWHPDAVYLINHLIHNAYY